MPFMASKKNRNKFLLKIIFFFGLILIIFGETLYFSPRSKILSFSETPPPVEVVSKTRVLTPTKLQIPKIDLDIPIEERTIKDGVWMISDNVISHLDRSARPGEDGNIVLYGHNRQEILGKLRLIKAGDYVFVTSGVVVHKYKIVSKVETSPDNLAYVLPKNNEILTIYTCTGFLDSKRLVVQAIPVR